MNVTTKLLRQMIKEQMDVITEVGAAKMATGEYRAKEMEQSRATQSGLTDEERAILNGLGTKLQRLAAKKDLRAAGTVTALLKRLDGELDKLDLN